MPAGLHSTGLLYLTSQDAAPAGGAHPFSNDWDNGTDQLDELIHKMRVRAIALDGFFGRKIPPGEPMASLEEVPVPVYLLCRYQIEAAASVIGGLYYGHTVRGGSQAAPSLVPARQQRRALAELLKTLSPDHLALPEHILKILPPRAPGLEQTRGLFPGYTGITFYPWVRPSETDRSSVPGCFNFADLESLPLAGASVGGRGGL